MFFVFLNNLDVLCNTSDYSSSVSKSILALSYLFFLLINLGIDEPNAYFYYFNSSSSSLSFFLISYSIELFLISYYPGAGKLSIFYLGELTLSVLDLNIELIPFYFL